LAEIPVIHGSAAGIGVESSTGRRGVIKKSIGWSARAGISAGQETALAISETSRLALPV